MESIVLRSSRLSVNAYMPVRRLESAANTYYQHGNVKALSVTLVHFAHSSLLLIATADGTAVWPD
jgi:hypothetical protein